MPSALPDYLDMTEECCAVRRQYEEVSRSLPPDRPPSGDAPMWPFMERIRELTGYQECVCRGVVVGQDEYRYKGTGITLRLRESHEEEAPKEVHIQAEQYLHGHRGFYRLLNCRIGESVEIPGVSQDLHFRLKESASTKFWLQLKREIYRRECY